MRWKFPDDQTNSKGQFRESSERHKEISFVLDAKECKLEFKRHCSFPHPFNMGEGIFFPFLYKQPPLLRQSSWLVSLAWHAKIFLWHRTHRPPRISRNKETKRQECHQTLMSSDHSRASTSVVFFAHTLCINTLLSHCKNLPIRFSNYMTLGSAPSPQDFLS